MYAQMDAKGRGQKIIKGVKLFLGNDCWHNSKIHFIY